uniref:Speckle-type POZ protein-like (inferred by orthology to a human protein) n=1 Tax=Strongyloides venezuelensis TaxID=75913 RepID=A0A0K0EWF0_STRVS
MFRILKELIPNMAPEKILLDFENATMNTARHTFQDVDIKRLEKNISIDSIWYNMNQTYVKDKHIYTIKNFDHRIGEPGEKIISEPFTFETTEKSEWYFCLYPNGQSFESKGYLSIIFKSLDYSGSKMKTKFKFSIVNNRREEKWSCESNILGSYQSVNYWTIPNFVSADILLNKSSGLLNNGDLILLFEIFLIGSSNNTIDNHSATKFKMNETLPKLDNHLDQTLREQQSTDFIIVVGKYNFYVHKNKLIYRSPVFGAMLKDELKECQMDMIEIVDFKADVVKEMLDYIYTDEAPNLKEMAFEVLTIADRYRLDGLESMATEHLWNKLEKYFVGIFYSGIFLK